MPVGIAGRLRWIGGLVLAAMLLGNPRAAAQGASRAMAYWCDAVAPALFPFLALMPLLTCREAADSYARLFGRAMDLLFELPGAAAPAVIIGMLAGAPAGAIAAREVAARCGMNRRQLYRITLAVTGFSPAFLVSGIGASVLGREDMGWKLLIAQLLTQLSMLRLLRHAWRERIEPVPAAADRLSEQPIRAAVLTLLTICGYMAFFGSLAAAMRDRLGLYISNAALCLLDVPSGARVIADISLDPDIKLLLLAAMCGMGGVCVALQNLNVLRDCGLGASEYALMRMFAAAISACWMLLIVKALPFDTILRVGECNHRRYFTLAALAVSILAVPVVVRCYRSTLLHKEARCGKRA